MILEQQVRRLQSAPHRRYNYGSDIAQLVRKVGRLLALLDAEVGQGAVEQFWIGRNLKQFFAVSFLFSRRPTIVECRVCMSDDEYMRLLEC